MRHFAIDQDFSSSLYVLHDDMESRAGRLKFARPGLSFKGHNGLRSIATRLDGNSFNRFRIGIGRPPHEVGEWVLG